MLGPIFNCSINDIIVNQLDLVCDLQETFEEGFGENCIFVKEMPAILIECEDGS